MALDVHYCDDRAVAAAISFTDWTSATPAGSHICAIAPVEPYQPGNFYLRELPCLLAALDQLGQAPGLVLIDGHVWLAQDQPGLGARLWQALGGSIPVVGVAKSAWHTRDVALPVMRGDSQRPLWVTSQGIDPEEAAAGVARMHGAHRLPTLLKLADSLCRGRGLTSRQTP